MRGKFLYGYDCAKTIGISHVPVSYRKAEKLQMRLFVDLRNEISAES